MTSPQNSKHLFPSSTQCSDGHYPPSSSFASNCDSGIKFQVTEPEPEDLTLRGVFWPRIDEVIQVVPDQDSSFRQGLQIPSRQTEIGSVFKRPIDRTMSTDDDYLSIYESEDGLAHSTGTAHDDDQNESSFPPLIRQWAHEMPPIKPSSSIITRLNRSSVPDPCPIFTIHPDAAFRADPHRRVRDHVLNLTNHWTQTRDTTLAAPFQADWHDHEAQLEADRHTAYVAHLRRQVKADKSRSSSSKWLLSPPRRIYLRAKDWLASRKQRGNEARSREVLSARLRDGYVEAQLALRRVLMEAQLSAAALEMYSGDGACGQFLMDTWLWYLREDAGRVFLPVRAEVPGIGIGARLAGEEEDGVPRWLEARYQDIDCGNGRERFIVRFFC
ncbi:hypothetical protein N0V82_005087 [Gnomoniopsis sp. IMI 355080]|nr:hypothetical protein N0V82_005087 [Gnomoniopsis sp. IMI 355080]